MTNTELHAKDLKMDKLEQELDFYKSTEKYRENIIKALSMMSILAAFLGFLMGISI